MDKNKRSAEHNDAVFEYLMLKYWLFELIHADDPQLIDYFFTESTGAVDQRIMGRLEHINSYACRVELFINENHDVVGRLKSNPDELLLF